MHNLDRHGVAAPRLAMTAEEVQLRAHIGHRKQQEAVIAGRSAGASRLQNPRRLLTVSLQKADNLSPSFGPSRVGR